MKKIIFILAFIITGTYVSAQGLNLGVIVPEETYDGVDAKSYKSLGSKLERMVTECGATSINSGNLVLFPVINFEFLK